MLNKKYLPISLNDIPRFSPWPRRLLGLDEWRPVKRDREKVAAEYDRDKYARCLAFFNGAVVRPTVENVRDIEFKDDKQPTCASIGDELFLAPFMDAYDDYYALIAENILPLIEKGTTVVELGCGYGYNLAMLQKRSTVSCTFRGGEYSQNAVELAGKLFEGQEESIKVELFDFYDSSYHILDDISGPIVLFTAGAVEQIPDIQNFFSVLPRYKDKVKVVIHCEPVYEFQSDDLLGLLRKRYMEVNDYNRNLASQLKNYAGDIEIIKQEKNVFGLNALNPASVIQWRFRR
ncbi:hypothetical protein A3F27_02245 [Candidatus Kaiserbacteria bacterium RIFCSPHIGHO2_12_FULL_53_13]|uniref:Methyltransferase domain-containing protein n=1 Tax=Candidatus Kaiserbacteria bacterium RIFCSPHIGHO2_12_FULL_53_13 TaxID=1798502 RepID=A0A1F6EC31_9BACT|nr:MAG: hypothetical protein A3F27_02245 [Candidatus Kaiserbacteria bacterium RIFCSPHIGHO2_12_FULL_53_13]OGG74693.1 MAG: hypothetical protein A3A37_02405 [Candidatus Kaiserbacteria bacterium RIFCSPLOWO2_01_FULL_52_36]